MKKENIKLSKDEKQQLQVKLQHYFLSERGEELGDLAAGMLLDFIVEELGDVIYNKAIDDAHRYMSERIEDLLELQRY